MKAFEAKDSSNVGWARYDESAGVLEVDFKNGAGVKTSTYTYDGTLANGTRPGPYPATEYERFQAAESKGRFFAYEIRPKFRGVKKA